MSLQMRPRTEPGAHLCELAEALIPRLRSRAEAADRANALCPENFCDLQSSGVAAAFVPKSLGGLGLESMHDWICCIATLARGDGSSAIAISMHLSATRGLAAAYRAAPFGSAMAARMRRHLEQVAAREMLICSTTTERGTDNLHPLTEAANTGAGWRLRGRKYFVTMSPIATHVALNVRVRGSAADASEDRIANVLLPMNTPGIRQHGDWDALGMRASGSQSIEFDDCQVPSEALRFIGPWGRWSVPVLVNRTLANVPLVGAFLGIAEHADELTRASLTNSTRAASAGAQHAVAEIAIAIATCQSLLSRIGIDLDQIASATAPPSYERAHELMKDYQSVKWVVNRKAIEVVSQSMDLYGGSGYLSSNTLSRLYRDVRAGPFMQPHSPIDAREYIGRVALGLYPYQ